MYQYIQRRQCIVYTVYNVCNAYNVHTAGIAYNVHTMYATRVMISLEQCIFCIRYTMHTNYEWHTSYVMYTLFVWVLYGSGLDGIVVDSVPFWYGVRVFCICYLADVGNRPGLGGEVFGVCGEGVTNSRYV